MNNEQLTPRITPTLITSYPDQLAHILNRFIEDFYEGHGGGGGSGNLESIEQTTTSYDDGGVNIVTAYLSDGTTSEFQIRNGRKGSKGDDGQSSTIAVGTTSTLPAGSSATVVNTGTASAAILDFGIPKGDKGDTGNPGAAATVNIGSTSTLAPGSSATVTNSGTSTAAVLNFGIPEGEKGDAATISVGSTTTLPEGYSATVTNVGTSSDAIFDFGIPKGATGAQGADGYSPTATVTKSGDTATITITDKNGTTTASVTDGSDGTAATITAGTTTTLPAGSSATVTNSGTSSAAVFDFGIPKGDTGAAGQDGADGFSPIATVSKVGDTATITITDENGTTTASVTDGSDGAPGAAATISAGTTTTLSPGSSATVTNSGTSSAAVFDFGIPQGATGAAGPANTLSIGTVQSGATADATITGTSPNQTLNLTLPQGSPGTSATVAAGTTTTLPAGSSATVTNSGTSSAAVFDFGIPTGADGADGAKGDPGKGCPVGSILPFSGSTLPDGYLECNGAAVSRTTYAELFSVIGTTYGAGDGSTTFNLPNLKGKVPVGQDTGDTNFDTLGETGGSKTHTITSSELPTHTHTYDKSASSTQNHTLTVNEMPSHTHKAMNYTNGFTGGSQNYKTVLSGTFSDELIDAVRSTGGGQGHNHNITLTSTASGNGGFANNAMSIVQPYITVKYIIKYTDMAATVADVLNAYSSSSTDVYSASYANTKFMYSAEAGNSITIDGLAAYLSGKQGMTGSVQLSQKSSGVGSSIPAGWYNYFWSPHRTGIGGDNDKYGTIILTPMTFDGSSWILRKSSSTTAVTSVKRILTDTVSSSQIDWSAFAMTTVGEVNTITPNGNVYSSDTYIRLDQNSNGRLFCVSGSLGWWKNSDWTTSGKTSLGNGYYGFKTTLKLSYHPSAVKIYPYYGISWNWVPGGADKVDGYGINSDNKNMLGIAIGTDGTLYVGVNKSSSQSGGAWWRIGVKYPGATLAI